MPPNVFDAESRPTYDNYFRLRTLEQIVDLHHPLVRLGKCIDWASFEEALGAAYHPTHGAPGISTRPMVALHYLKYRHDPSDEAVVAHWMENPYWQHFGGMKYFQHRMPLDASSMTRWRGRLGETGAEQMLRETIAAGIKTGAIRAADLKRINVDTSVQTKAGVPGDRSSSLGWKSGVPGDRSSSLEWKAIRYPTDARLYHRCRERLVKAARREGLTIEQSYRHVGKRLRPGSSRYAHARQMKRARACTRKLRTQLGRVTREIERQVTNPSEKLAKLLATAHRIYTQQRHDKDKIYSVHEPGGGMHRHG